MPIFDILLFGEPWTLSILPTPVEESLYLRFSFLYGCSVTSMLATEVNYSMEVFEFLGICTSEMLFTSSLEVNFDEFSIKID